MCLRFFTVYGARQRPDLAIHKFAKLIDAGQPIPVFGDGTTRRDYTYVDDIIAGVRAAIDYTASDYEVINLGESRTVELRELIALLEKELGRDALIDRQAMQPGDVPQTFADITKARRLLGYNPQTNIEEGIRRFVEWFTSKGSRGRASAACDGATASEVQRMKIYDAEETLTRQGTLVATATTVDVEGGARAPEISLFLPVLNEEPNLIPLHAKIDEALTTLGRTAEIIYVDDGSTDGGLEVAAQDRGARPARASRRAAPQLRADGGDGCRYRRGARRRAGSDGRRHAERPGGHRAAARKTRRRLRRGFRLAQGASGQDGHAQDSVDDRQPAHLEHRRRQAPRLRLLVESVPP